MTDNAKAFDREGLISYLEHLLHAAKTERVDPVSFGYVSEERAVPSLEGVDLHVIRSGDHHHHIHVRDPRLADELAKLRRAHESARGRSLHLFDVDPSEFGPSRGVMPLDDPRFDVWAAGAAHVLKKRLQDVTSHERHRFRMAYLNAFSVMSTDAHDAMAALRFDEGRRATPAQCDGAATWPTS